MRAVRLLAAALLLAAVGCGPDTGERDFRRDILALGTTDHRAGVSFTLEVDPSLNERLTFDAGGELRFGAGPPRAVEIRLPRVGITLVRSPGSDPDEERSYVSGTARVLAIDGQIHTKVDIKGLDNPAETVKDTIGPVPPVGIHGILLYLVRVLDPATLGPLLAENAGPMPVGMDEEPRLLAGCAMTRESCLGRLDEATRARLRKVFPTGTSRALLTVDIARGHPHEIRVEGDALFIGDRHLPVAPRFTLLQTIKTRATR